MYCPFTACLIRYRNSGTLRVRVQGTYSARYCQGIFDYYTNERCSSVTPTVDSRSWVQRFRARARVALLCSKFHGLSSFRLLVCVFRPFTVRLASG